LTKKPTAARAPRPGWICRVMTDGEIHHFSTHGRAFYFYFDRLACAGAAMASSEMIYVWGPGSVEAI
jgi:hypothetical protein